MPVTQPRLNVGLTGGLRRSQNTGAVAAVGASYDALQDATNAVGNLGNALALNMMEKSNEAAVHEAELQYRNYKTEILYGEKGIAHRRGRDALGMTEEAAKQLHTYLQDVEKEFPNHVVRTAVRRRVEKDIAETNSLLSKHEYARTEEHRISLAAGVEATLRQEAVQQHTDRLYAPGLVEDEVEERTRLVMAQNPGMSALEAKTRVDLSMADDAALAVMRLMDDGPQNLAEAQHLISFYSDTWDPRQRTAAIARVENEVSFGMMQGVVRQAAVDLPAGFTRKELVEAAEDQFRSAYLSQFGREPSDKLLAEVGREAAAWDALVDDDLAQREEEMRAGHLTNVMALGREGDLLGMENAYQAAVKEAIGADDFKLLEDLDALKANFDGTGSFFADSMTPTGAELWLIPEDQKLSQAQLLAGAAHMTDSEWRTWVGKHQADSREEALTGVGKLVSPQPRLRDAINRYRTLQGENPFKNSDQELGRRLAHLTLLDEQFVKQNNRRAIPSELDEMVRATEYDLDDYGRDRAVNTLGESVQSSTGSVGDFLTAPTPLDINSTQDKRLLDATLYLLESNSALASEVTQYLGGDLSKLPTDGELIAEILRYGLVTDAQGINRRLYVD